MEFNRCSRCGAFYISDNKVCPNCAPKDACDILTVKSYLEENEIPSSIENLASSTGISIKNLNRFINDGNINISL